MGKMTIASKLLTNRRVRQAAVELLKDPRADKRALAAKLITNRRVRQGAVRATQGLGRTRDAPAASDATVPAPVTYLGVDLVS